VPDYALAEDLDVSTPAQLHAMAGRLRSSILDCCSSEPPR